MINMVEAKGIKILHARVLVLLPLDSLSFSWSAAYLTVTDEFATFGLFIFEELFSDFKVFATSL